MADKSASLIINIVVNDANAGKAVRRFTEEVNNVSPAAARATEAVGGISPAAAGLDKAAGSTKKLSAELKEVTPEAEKVTQALIGLAAVVAGKFSYSSIKSGLNEVIALAGVQESAEIKLAAVLRQTGQASGITAEEIYNYAGALQSATTFGDEATIATAAVVATFKSITGDEFKRVLAAAQDMSALLGSDLTGAAMQLAKALEEPVVGITALRRAGVSFNETEKETIRILVESGRQQEAQRLILASVEGQLQGVAAALRGTYQGAVVAAGNAWGDLKEELGFFITKNEAVVASVGRLEQHIVGATGKINTLRLAIADSDIAGPIIMIGTAGVAAFAAATAAAVVYNSALGALIATKAALVVSSVAAAAALAVPYAVIAAGGTSIYLAVKTWGEMREAQQQAAEAGKRAAEQQERYFDRLDRASAAAGVQLNSWQEVQAAYQAGTLDYDKMTDTYSKGSGVARAAAEVHVDSAAAVEGAAKKARKSIEELEAENKVAFDNAKKKYEEYAKGIKEASSALATIGLRPSAALGGFVDLNDALVDIAETGRVAGSTLIREFDEAGDVVQEYYAGLGGLSLGFSDLAESLFDLSLVGKNQEQIWKANQVAAEQYLRSAKELGEQARAAALAGDDAAAQQLWDAEAAAIAKADAAYRKLAVTVREDWSPAMEEAHRASAETIAEYGSAAQSALEQARRGYDQVADAAKRGADAQQYFADILADIAREGMTDAQVYEDIKRAAGEATAEAQRFAEAGDFTAAQEQAKAAAAAWSQLPKEIKEGEDVLVSAAESAAVRADGIRKAAEISATAFAAEKKALEEQAAAAQKNAEIIIKAEQAIIAATAAKLAALKAGDESAVAAADKQIAAAKARADAAQKEVQEAARLAGDGSGAAATQEQINKINELVRANEEAAEKIIALEEEKSKVISSEAENAKIAAQGVVAAQQQLANAYDEQRQTLQGLADVEVAMMEAVVKATSSASAEIQAAAFTARKELESIQASIDAIPKNTNITITVTEVQARYAGGMVWGPNMSQGALVSGPRGYDSVKALLAGGEAVTKNKVVSEVGYGLFHQLNNRQYANALRSLAAFHGPAATARLLADSVGKGITLPQLPSLRQVQQDSPEKSKNFGTIHLSIGDVSVPAMVQTDHIALFRRAEEKARQRIQRSTGKRQ